MSSSVKIKKARVLRNNFIAMMYLLFIALSVINIPIDWLHVNKYLAPALTETTRANFSDPELDQIHDELIAVKDEFFVQLGYDEETGLYREPNGYAVTDQFFINEGNGDKLRAALEKVPGIAKQYGGTKEELFAELFAEDIKNGLLEESSQWSDWKFKHAPASLVEVLMGELILRLRLISGDLEVRSGEGKSSGLSIVEYATNLDYLVFGDTLKVKSSHENIMANIVYGGDTLDMENLGGTLAYVPKRTGAHTLVLRSDWTEETYTFRVLPAQIPSTSKAGFITYFENTPSEIKFGTVISDGTLKCSCDEQATFKNGTIAFQPKEEGWCKFSVRGANGLALMSDSIYVQPNPKPYFKIKGLQANGTLPKGQTSVELEAFHPAVKTDYTIDEVVYQTLGANSKTDTIQGSIIDMGDFQGTLWIKYIVATSGSRTYKTDKSYIVTIEP